MTDETSGERRDREDVPPRVAVFRPDDERIREAVALLESLGAEPVADPMLAIEETGAVPRGDADAVIFTSATGAGCLPGDWSPGDAAVCAIGPSTADALRDAGIGVDLVPGTYSSAGLVAALRDGAEERDDIAGVEGARVEVARSDHGSDVLLEGLDDAGAYHHETVLYRLVRPEGAGASAERAAAGELDAALFTSSLTAEHFLAAAGERGVREPAIGGLEGAVVGAIGDPTRETAEEAGIAVDVVPEEATFEALARAVLDSLDRA
ncbi:MAG: uroporphyrinogen-III synthase [Halobacteriales archaeon]